MIFTELSETEQLAIGVLLGRYTNITQNQYNRMEDEEKELWHTFCALLAEMENTNAEKGEVALAEEFLKKLK